MTDVAKQIMETLYDVKRSDRELLNHPPDGLPGPHETSYWMCFGLWHAPPSTPSQSSAPHSSSDEASAATSQQAVTVSCSAFRDAACAMAVRVGELAQLQPHDHVLEVGCGAGDSLRVWMQHFKVKHVAGLEIVRSQQALAAERAARWVHALEVAPTDTQVAPDPTSQTGPGHAPASAGPCTSMSAGSSASAVVQLCSATAMLLPEASLDAVLAIDCAYHFHTRAAFFQEAARVLRPQGRLALVEAVWDPSQLSWAAAACISKALAFLAQVPVENQGPVSQLEGHLQQAGFEVRHLQDITHLVVPGFVQFVQAASRGLVVQAPDSIMSGSCRQCGVGGTGEGGGDGCRHAHVPQAQSTTSMSWGLRLRWLRFRLLAAFLSTAAQWKLLRFFEVVVVKGT